MIPLILKLKKTRHKEIAKAQDMIIEELYRFFDKAVLHGGTAIWRCYSGNRFSEDIDVYLRKDIKKVNALFDSLEKKGFIIKKKKISEKSIFSNLQINRTMVRFEAVFKEQEGFLKEYETSDGNLITIYTLIPEILIKEKVNAYLNRFKIRDLYDIFFLLRYVKNKKEVEKELKRLLKNFKDPLDKENLKIFIIVGLTPDVQAMLSYIERWM
ncbi:MAG: nucleotidyl transferase AbiEii/AbiGii toxin family protein [Nanoarchaeota archaeon]|nr:nucleotidyl transferase AbiEii/AbiGii toxin family protein [Nanoarchaeota archaeon]MBU1321511.1 nucleotidyl transferase AbiEii/AbiGii toxin family protein [Nanoarchaeota archaeon]MBU1597128.1 nucleotidyl transferase AbiEii/AbiGii toxin family protein [Nanoarchaeota archaeon]MBU2441538.1 nucleotidyl transferase AbiEii/AbiGii toxin family protein [Nanoarchaeota archaeon]